MNVNLTSKNCYELQVTDGENLLLDELGAIYGMPRNTIIRMMMSFAMHMARTRIINEIEKGA